MSTTTNGKANGHDRPPFAEPIREQGPKDYPTMRKRVEAARDRDAGEVRTVEGKPLDVSDREPGSMPLLRDLVRTLAGRPADATLPAGAAPLLSTREEAQRECDHANGVVRIAAFEDGSDGLLLVEHDRRDGRYFVTAISDDREIEVPVEVPAAVARGVAAVLASGGATDRETSTDPKPVKPTSTAVQQGLPVPIDIASFAARLPVADVENDGDRGPRLPSKAALSPREVFARAAAALPDEWIPVATWILQRLPTLCETVRDLTMATAEPVDRFATTHEKSTLVATPREHIALASLWRAVLDVSRLIDPHRDVRRGGAR